MDPSEYRKRYQEQLERAAKEAPRFRELMDRSQRADAGAPGPNAAAGQRSEDEVAEATGILLDRTANAQRRAIALEAISVEAGKRPDLIDVLLGLVRDSSEAVELRLKALSILRAAAFRAAMFAPKRAEFLDALRSIIDDPHAALREQALEALAQQKDEYAQRRLVEGLENPAGALVAPEKALQFLGYDIHAGHYALLQNMVRNPPNPAAKLEAVRLLGSDSASKDLLKELFLDSSEEPDVRTASAGALQSLAPAEFNQLAKRIALDEGEHDDVRAASISALDHAAGPQSAADSSDFLERIEQLEASSSGELHRAASRFVARRRR